MTPRNPATAPEASHALQLSTTLHEVDRQVQQGCAEISALAQLALAWLEIPEGLQRMEVVAQALQAMRGSADALAEFSGGEARALHCGFEDPAQVRRGEAARAVGEMGAHAYTVVGPGVAR